jgi:hypothetical protein
MSEKNDENLVERLNELEGRLRLLEDEAAVLRLVFSWGPAVDTGSSSEAGALWAEDGVLDSDMSRLEGPSEVTAMVLSDGQQSLIRQGSAHVQSAPIVTIDGDEGVVTTYSQVFLHAEGDHRVWRVSANQWVCRRTEEGWKLIRRVNRVIDGSPGPREILAQAIRSGREVG